MPSDRQLKANRRNAALGGPKTEAGRAAVCLNALKHGCTAATLVLPGEDAEALKQLREDLFDEYRPASPTEQLLFDEFVRCSWLLLRLRRVETEMWTGHIIGMRTRQAESRDVTQQEADRALAATLAENPASHFVNYFRYERMITRNFYRALDKLEAVQRARRRAQPLPAAVPDPAPAPEPVSAAPLPPPRHSERRPQPPPELSGNGIGTVSPLRQTGPGTPPDSAPNNTDPESQAA